MDEHNPFLALAKSLWARGDDGEDIAADLAKALMYMIKEGNNEPNLNPATEFIRLNTAERK